MGEETRKRMRITEQKQDDNMKRNTREKEEATKWTTNGKLNREKQREEEEKEESKTMKEGFEKAKKHETGI